MEVYELGFLVVKPRFVFPIIFKKFSPFPDCCLVSKIKIDGEWVLYVALAVLLQSVCCPGKILCFPRLAFRWLVVYKVNYNYCMENVLD